MKAGFSIKQETMQRIVKIAEQTHRTQGAVVDIAIEALAQIFISEDGAVDLPASQHVIRPRASARIRARKEKIDAIPGLKRGLKAE